MYFDLVETIWQKNHKKFHELLPNYTPEFWMDPVFRGCQQNLFHVACQSHDSETFLQPLWDYGIRNVGELSGDEDNCLFIFTKRHFLYSRFAGSSFESFRNTVDWLLEHGIDISARNRDGETVADVYVQNAHDFGDVKVLLERGATLQHFYMLFNGHYLYPKIVELLLSQGRDPNEPLSILHARKLHARKLHATTPLDVLLWNKNNLHAKKKYKCICLLLSYGATILPRYYEICEDDHVRKILQEHEENLDYVLK